MRLHVLGIPHTQTQERFSHCAFTQKVLKFLPMMAAQGYDCVHYGVGDETPKGAAEHVELFSAEFQAELLGFVPGEDPKAFVGNPAHVENPAYRIFNSRLKKALRARVEPEDIVCLPFGHAHEAGTRDHAGVNVETGIGYPVCIERFRIYESNAWMSFHAGKDGTGGSDYHWVIPNYFDAVQWDLGTAPRRYLAYLGRIDFIKGMNVLLAIARARPDLEIRIAGQGDPKPWLDLGVPNLVYVGPLVGRERSDFLGGALALLAPSQYIEPFCGVTVEANLCGTPAITTDFGAFPETVKNGVNGWRCHTLGDWLVAIRWAETPVMDIRRPGIREAAVRRYSLEAIGPKYTAVFDQIADLCGDNPLGWNSTRTNIPMTIGYGA